MLSRTKLKIKNSMIRPIRTRVCCCALAVLTLLGSSTFSESVVAKDNRFENVEIRVIRPRYFNKRGRFELGAELSTVMNETFIYTYLATGMMAYHFSETLALEFSGAFGFSIDKEDKRLLFEEFEIKTKIFRTLYLAEAALQWTPIYGKWQLPSGRLIYFDTYLAAGGGMTGIDWKYSDFCVAPDLSKNPNAEPLPSDTVKAYPTFMLGLGQRYFLNKNMALKWNIRNHSMLYNKLDAECAPATVGETGGGGNGVHNNITLQFGASKFF